jgi:hypothetical protein
MNEPASLEQTIARVAAGNVESIGVFYGFDSLDDHPMIPTQHEATMLNRLFASREEE